MNEVLARWNAMTSDDAAAELLSCCASRAWAKGMASARPLLTPAEVFAVAATIWRGLSSADWLEAFLSHPRIGESRAQAAVSATSQSWSSQEQRLVAEGDPAIRRDLAEGNRLYEDRFGRTFIVCASGKPPHEILRILRQRLQNDDAGELLASAAEQQEITKIRLRKWLGE